MTTNIREFLEMISTLKANAMRVRERQNHNAETIPIPRIRDCGIEETKIMEPIRFEAEVIPGDNDTNYQEQAIQIVYDYILSGFPPAPGYHPPIAPYVVWFCKVLQNWKALVGSPIIDGKYYEVTYNGDKNEYYLDEYGKIMNLVLRGQQ